MIYDIYVKQPTYESFSKIFVRYCRHYLTMNTFDYNINNYSISELKKIIGIPSEEPLAYPVIHAAVAKRLSTAANNPSAFRFFSQIKDRLTRVMMNGTEDDEAEDDEAEAEAEDEAEDDIDNKNEMDLHRRILSLQRPAAPTIFAQINDGVPFGNMNPLNRNTVSKVVCIDSLFRKSPDTTPEGSFLVNLPGNLERVISLSLTSINLPTNWYSVADDTTLNTFSIITHNGPAGTITHTVTVPAGNYTAAQMETTLNNIFSNTSDLSLLRAEINPVTLKTTFRTKISNDPGVATYAFEPTASPPYPNFSYEVHFQTVTTAPGVLDCDTGDITGTVVALDQHNIGYILGFRNPDYVIEKLPEELDIISVLDNTLTYNCILRSESVFNPTVIDYVFLELDDFNNNFVTNTVVSKTQSGYIGNNILAKIPVYSTQQLAQVATGNTGTFKTRDYFGPVNIKKLAVRLLDKRGNVVDLRGNNFSFTVEVTLQYS